MPSYAPSKTPRHKPVSQNVPREEQARLRAAATVLGSLAVPHKKVMPRKTSAPLLNENWKIRAANTLPKLMAARTDISPHHSDYTHWSEAIGHMHHILEGSVTTNRQAQLTFDMAQRAALRALGLRADAG